MTPGKKLQAEAARVATQYLIRGLGNVGQTDEERRRAERAYLEFAGFKDPESTAARSWLSWVTKKTPWGTAERETAHLTRAVLAERRTRVPSEGEDAVFTRLPPKHLGHDESTTRKLVAQGSELEPRAQAALEGLGCSPRLIQALGLLVAGYRAWVGPFDEVASDPGLRSPESREALRRLARRCFDAAECLSDDSTAAVQAVARKALEDRTVDSSPAELAAALRVVARVAEDFASDDGPPGAEAKGGAEAAMQFGLEVARLCRRHEGPEPDPGGDGPFREVLEVVGGAAGLSLPHDGRFYVDLRSALAAAQIV